MTTREPITLAERVLALRIFFEAAREKLENWGEASPTKDTRELARALAVLGVAACDTQTELLKSITRGTHVKAKSS